MSKTIAIASAVIGLGGILTVAALTPPTESAPDERCANGHPLKTLASAQADFHANDRDNNDTKDFWRRDVAGLYTTTDDKGTMIRLIELSVALADENPASDPARLGVRAPKNGYWMRTLLHEDEDPAKPDRQRFAYAAVPVDPKQYTYIVDENYTVFRAKLPPGQTVWVFPKELTHWSKLD